MINLSNPKFFCSCFDSYKRVVDKERLNTILAANNLPLYGGGFHHVYKNSNGMVFRYDNGTLDIVTDPNKVIFSTKYEDMHEPNTFHFLVAPEDFVRFEVRAKSKNVRKLLILAYWAGVKLPSNLNLKDVDVSYYQHHEVFGKYIEIIINGTKNLIYIHD